MDGKQHLQSEVWRKKKKKKVFSPTALQIEIWLHMVIEAFEIFLSKQ